MDLVIQRSGMGAVPGCTRAGLPMVARRGSEVRGKSDKGDKPRKGEAQRCAGGPGWLEWVWWAHRKYPTHRKSGATRAGL